MSCCIRYIFIFFSIIHIRKQKFSCHEVTSIIYINTFLYIESVTSFQTFRKVSCPPWLQLTKFRCNCRQSLKLSYWKRVTDVGDFMYYMWESTPQFPPNNAILFNYMMFVGHYLWVFDLLSIVRIYFFIYIEIVFVFSSQLFIFGYMVVVYNLFLPYKS